MLAQIKGLMDVLPEGMRNQFYVSTWSFLNVPMIFWVRPKVVSLNSEKTEVIIPLRRRTKNHLKSMYFGALCTGADIAGGILASRLIMESGKNVSLAFKDFKADYKKLALGDVLFRCDEGAEIQLFLNEVLASNERLNKTVNVTAYCPDIDPNEVVAEFELTLSLRNKTKNN